jgi:glycosyltransferase involved in cell wall biosynthesis
MKIAQIVCVYPPYRGGIGKAAKDNSDFLLSRGHEVAVFTPKRKNFTSNEKEVKMLKPLLSLGNAGIMHQLFYSLSDFDAVILHYPFFGSAEIVYLLKFLFPKKFRLLIHYHMDVPDLGLLKKVFSLPGVLIRKRLFKSADLILVSSLDYVKTSQIRKVYLDNKEKFVEFPFSVNHELFHPPVSKKNQPVQILFVGGMDKAHHFKGVEVLLKAFAGLKEQAILNLVGSGDLQPGYRQLAKRLGVEERVNFLGNLSSQKLAEEYRSADIFVLPSVSRHEAFGIVLLEAMSSGLPLIASDLPGVRTVFEEGEQGMFVRPGDKKSLEQALQFLVRDDNKRQTMGKKSRELAVKKYDAKINNTKLEQALESILNK